MSMGGGGGGSTTTVQKADPWAGVQPALSQLYGSALDQFRTGGASYYPNTTVAPSNSTIGSALQMGINRATGGSPLMADARGQNDFTMNGGYLQNNPTLDATYKAATDPMVEQFKNATAPGIASQFSMAGRMGSGSHDAAMGTAETALGRGLGTASANIYGNAYENERQRQQAAIGMAPTLAAADYNDIEKLMGIGQYQQSQQQDLINADKARFDFGQNRGPMNLQQLNSLLTGASAYSGQTSTGNQSLNRNPFASAVGGAALGGSLAGMSGGMFGGPVGMGIGALLGGLFG